MNSKVLIKNNIEYQIEESGKVTVLKTGKILKPKISKQGYITVYNKRKRFHLHRLIAEAFIPTSDYSLCVNHINGIKTDNSLDNLEWTTLSGNTKHAHDTGLINNTGMKNGRSRLTKQEAIEIYNNPKTHKEIAIQYGICRPHVTRIKNKQYWKSIHK